MRDHTYFEESLPVYSAGGLSAAERAEVEQHLAGCAQCREDVELWSAVSLEIGSSNRGLAAPPSLAERALEQIHRPGALAQAWRHMWQLLRSQAALVQRELWPACAAVMALGVSVALISRHVEAVYFFAPLVAAASLSILFGPAHDPAYELSLSTPTSPWKLLLARLSIVSAYNLLLLLAAGAVLLAMVPTSLLLVIILGWLAPMAFLSALALLLALWMDSSNAMIIVLLLWIAQYAPFKSLNVWISISPTWLAALREYQHFWQSPALLLTLAICLTCAALWSAERPTFKLSHN